MLSTAGAVVSPWASIKNLFTGVVTDPRVTRSPAHGAASATMHGHALRPRIAPAGATSPCSTSGASCALHPAMHARRRQRRHAGAWQLHAHVADKWKLPPAGTPAETVAQWQAGDKELHGFLAASIPEALQHTGSAAFDQHLQGVQAVLRNWGADEAVCRAGLFHSIYGTEGFQGFKLPFTNRKRIRALIGARAERLVWAFCVVDRLSVDTLVRQQWAELAPSLPSDFATRSPPPAAVAIPQHWKYEAVARVELGRFPVPFSGPDEWFDFVELTLADWLEQVEGAAGKRNKQYGWAVGEAWSYRREAYHIMAELLVAVRGPRLEAARKMVAEVYAAEPPATRQLHMPVTPPLTPAAREAREALASIADVD